MNARGGEKEESTPVFRRFFVCEIKRQTGEACSDFPDKRINLGDSFPESNHFLIRRIESTRLRGGAGRDKSDKLPCR